MTWGKMAREALQACAQKCRLIPHFDTLCPSASLLQGSFICLLPTVLVMEHFEKTIRARCQRALCMLNKEPPSTSSPVHSFWIKPCRNVKVLRRAEGPHSSGPLCSRGPCSSLVAEVAGRQLAGHSRQGLNTSETLSVKHKHTQSCSVSTVLLSKSRDDWSPVSVEKEHFSGAYSLSASLSLPSLSRPPAHSKCKSSCGTRIFILSCQK